MAESGVPARPELRHRAVPTALGSRALPSALWGTTFP